MTPDVRLRGQIRPPQVESCPTPPREIVHAACHRWLGVNGWVCSRTARDTNRRHALLRAVPECGQVGSGQTRSQPIPGRSCRGAHSEMQDGTTKPTSSHSTYLFVISTGAKRSGEIRGFSSVFGAQAAERASVIGLREVEPANLVLQRCALQTETLRRRPGPEIRPDAAFNAPMIAVFPLPECRHGRAPSEMQDGTTKPTSSHSTYLSSSRPERSAVERSLRFLFCIRSARQYSLRNEKERQSQTSRAAFSNRLS